jgi:hypothetical protein
MTITRDDPRFWDVRTLERRFRRGQVSKKDYDKHLKSLPDSADKAAPTPSDDTSDGHKGGRNSSNGLARH